MPDPLLSRLADVGAVGIIAALAVWQVFYLTRKLLTVIENNTKAMTELKDHCKAVKESR
jgi:hypothetical protein